MKDYDKFTTVSNFVDTRGICWLFGWGYFNDQSANKTQKRAENLEVWDVIYRRSRCAYETTNLQG